MRLFVYVALIWLFCGSSESLIFGKRRRRRSPAVNCAVSGFSAWTACTVSCGTGTSSRSRSITRHPANGGAACPHLVENTKCNTQLCPVDCQLTIWSPWSTCDVTCGEGQRSRIREVVTGPKYGGKDCEFLEVIAECKEQPECLSFLQKMILSAQTRKGLGVLIVVLLALSIITRMCCGKEKTD